MREQVQLILAAGIAVVLAWAFWHFLGKDAFSVLPTVMLIVVIVDNVRLRRQLRSNRAAPGSDT